MAIFDFFAKMAISGSYIPKSRTIFGQKLDLAVKKNRKMIEKIEKKKKSSIRLKLPKKSKKNFFGGFWPILSHFSTGFLRVEFFV